MRKPPPCAGEPTCPTPTLGALKKAVRNLAKTAGALALRPRNWRVGVDVTETHVAERAAGMRWERRVTWTAWIEDVGEATDQDADRVLEKLADEIRRKR